MDIVFTQRVTVPKSVLMRELAGESVILNLDSEVYFGLDEVGTGFWTALTAVQTIQEAFERLLAEYDVDADTLKQDLVRLITELHSNGLIELSDT